MLNRLQMKYAGKPVRFLVFPCNLFAQEPASNAEVKRFAEQSIALAKAGLGSNTIMFAKSNLNNVPCAYAGRDACTPASADCCPQNDKVYDYLLSQTKPGVIKWNFDKIITDKDGKPYAGEVILHGESLDATLSAIIDDLLTDVSPSRWAVDAPIQPFRSNPILLGLPLCVIFASVVTVFLRSMRSSQAGINSVDENSGEYIRVEE